MRIFPYFYFTLVCFTSYIGTINSSLQPQNATLSRVKRQHVSIIEVIRDRLFDRINRNRPIPLPLPLPNQFDARLRWPECHSVINHINSQGCGNCWSIASTDSLSDRLCIASGGRIQVRLSTWNLQTCCGMDHCGSRTRTGCSGGYVGRAMKYFTRYGLASEACQKEPYLYYYDDPGCKKQCDNPSMSYSDHLYYGNKSYHLPTDEREIREDIFKYGSVAAMFDSSQKYEDNGIYYCNRFYYPIHVVRIVGWGEQNGVKYWLAANSWGRYQHDNGFFKIARGVNTCGIEQNVYTANARV